MKFRVPSSKFRAAARPPLERMAFIARQIRNGAKFNFRTVAVKFETSQKTIQRDIDFMRDRLGYEMEFVSIGGGQGGYWIGHEPKERIL